MAYTVDLQGRIVTRLVGSAALLALAPGLNVMGGLTVEEADICSGGLLLVTDDEDEPVWVHDLCRYERHRVGLEVFARDAEAPEDPDDPPPAVPAEEILDVAESLINWEHDILADVIADGTVTPILIQRLARQREVVKRRDPGARRVTHTGTVWKVEFEFNLS